MPETDRNNSWLPAWAMRLITWNVQGLGEIQQGSIIGRRLLANFQALGLFDLLMVQEHKLTEHAIAFTDKRIGQYRSFWSPANGTKGGLAIFVGTRYEDKVLDSGVDPENSYLWIKVAM